MIDSLSKKSYMKTLILLFIVAFIPRFILVFLNHTPLRTPMDEFCTMATAAHMAGLDWTDTVVRSYHYYGGGFTILLAPLFKWISNPFALYAAVLCVAGALQSLIAPIAFHLMYRYFGIRNRWYLYLGALASSLMVAVRTTLFYNEHPTILLFWLIVWILCILLEQQDNYRKQAKWSVILMLVLGYCLTIHARTKIYYIALVVLVLGYFLFYKKWLIAKIPAIISGVAAYFLAQRFIDWIKATVFLYEEGDFLKNTEVSLHLSLNLLLSPKSWQGWLATIIGQVHVSTIFTVGFAGIAIPLIVVFLYRSITGSPALSRYSWTKDRSALVTLERPYLVVVALFCVLCIGGTIFAQSLSWLFRVKSALEEYTYGTNAYGYKAFTYFRYYAVYIGPFFLVALTLLYHAKDLVRKYWGYILTFFVMLQALFACFVLPHITNNTVASEIYWPFAFWKSLSSDQKMRTHVYVLGILVAVVFFLIFFFCYLKKKILVPLVLLTLMLLYHYCYSSLYVDGTYTDKYSDRAAATYALITSMEEDGCELPHDLYTVDINSNTQKRIYTQQFLLNDYHLIPARPEADVEAAIVFCNKANNEKLLNMDYVQAQLDSNEYLYIKGEEYIELFESYGVVFSE